MGLIFLALVAAGWSGIEQGQACAGPVAISAECARRSYAAPGEPQRAAPAAYGILRGFVADADPTMLPGAVGERERQRRMDVFLRELAP